MNESSVQTQPKGIVFQPHPASKTFIDLTGKTYGRLTVIGLAPKRRQSVMWHCKCACGNYRIVSGVNLKQGFSESCGCLNSEVLSQRNTTHGLSLSTEHKSWIGMRQRCCNPRNPSYKRYGGRGITMHEEWKGCGGFEKFLQCVGSAPSRSHSIDRINNDGNYEPGNVRWATSFEQANNNRSNFRIEINGVTKTLAEWVREYRTNYGTVLHRIKNMHMDPLEALTNPIKQTGRRHA